MSSDITIRLEVRGQSEMVYFRVPPSISDEVREALHDAGATTTKIAEFALDPVAVVVGVLAAPGMWLSLRAAINAIGARHKDKTFRLTLTGQGQEESIEINGHSAKETERLLNAAGELYERQAEEWRRIAGGDR